MIGVPVENLFLRPYDILDTLIHRLEVTIGYDNLIGLISYLLTVELGLFSQRTAISRILSVFGFRPVISQSIHTRGHEAGFGGSFVVIGGDAVTTIWRVI